MDIISMSDKDTKSGKEECKRFISREWSTAVEMTVRLKLSVVSKVIYRKEDVCL